MNTSASFPAPVAVIEGLSALSERYDALVCDVWGVVHNGVEAYPAAVEALTRFRKERGGIVVLVTNSPRPHGPVLTQLEGFGVTEGAFDAVVTSGDVTHAHLARMTETRVYHIGPERDLSLYEGTSFTLADPNDAEVVCVTGLVNDEVETPDDYRTLLEGFAARRLPLVSANPDIVVERGFKMIWCGGALARLYAELGGPIVQLGKPHAPIYRAAFARIKGLAGAPVAPERILAVGDGLHTDMRGATDQGIDALFVTAGIHGADFGAIEAPDAALVTQRLATEKVRAVAAIPYLAW